MKEKGICKVGNSVLQERIKILVINTVGLNRNGITQVIFDYYSRFDMRKYDVCVGSGEQDSEEVRQMFRDAGIKVRLLPSRRQKTAGYVLVLYRLMAREKYDIIHVHGNSATMAMELMAARAAGCPVRIAHVHNSTCDARRADRLMRPAFYRSYTDAYACGQMAGEWMYGGRNFRTVKNGRSIRKFSYDPAVRLRMREKCGLGPDTLAVGHVGNFNEQKNHPFLLRVFQKIRERQPDAKLFLAGYGHCEGSVRALVKELELEDGVVFLGLTDRIQDLLQAMDVMVLPSRHEGLPLVAVEWQMAALPCVLSDAITEECAFTDLVRFLSLDERYEKWADTVLEMRHRDRARDALLAEELAGRNGYDIEKDAAWLMAEFDRRTGRILHCSPNP